MILNPVGYIREPTEVRFGRYANGQIAIFTVDGCQCPAVKLTVCLDHSPLATGEEFVWIKTWSENAGVMEQAVADGIIEPPTLAYEISDFGSKAHLCRLTPAALAELNKEHWRNPTLKEEKT